MQTHTTILTEASNGDDNHDSVWALIDLEEDHARRQLAWDAKKQGEAAGIRMALSDPCYEMWTLLHLVDTGRTFNNCSAVIACIEIEWRKKFNRGFGPKAQADYAKILLLRDEAAKRAKAHRENNDPSWTEVYLLIEEIDRRASDQGTTGAT